MFCNVIYAQDVKVSQGRLSIDGLLWLQYINTFSSISIPEHPLEDTIFTNSFTRRAAFIGLTANLNNWASGRIYFDIADITGKPAYDLYALLKPKPNLSFVIGQFKLPLGVEMLTKPENLELIEYSLIGRDPLRAPKGTRDIGMQVSYRHSLTDVAIAFVNGNGRNVLKDHDKNKCVAGRFVIKPLQKSNIFAGVNYYTGNYNMGTVEFSRLGAELNYIVKPIIVKAELLSTKDNARTGFGYYAQVGYNWMWLQPVFRYSTFKYESYDYQNEIVFGLNFRPLSDNLKIMLNYKIEKTTFVETKIDTKGLLAQLQFAF